MNDLTRRAERALDVLNLILSDVRYGLGAYLAVYLLSEHNWAEDNISYALSLGGLTGLVAQTPLGAVVDAVRAKRALIAVSVLAVTGMSLLIPLAPHFWPVAAAGVIGSLFGCMVGPALAGISLGVVGPAGFARRAGRNESLFHAGNALCNVVVLAVAPWHGSAVVFWLLGLTGVASAFAVAAVPERAIDHDLARGFNSGARGPRPSVLRTLVGSPALMAFAGTGALFHMANGAMLGLVAQHLARLWPGQGIALTAACAIAAQCVMVPVAALAGLRADRWGRKPLLMAAFLGLALRGALYTLSDDPRWLIAVQLLDGLGAGLIGALFPVVVEDLTQGKGHFAAAQGAVGTVHGIGGICSGLIAGQVVVHAGYTAAFLTLACIALVGAVAFWWAMPETRGWAEAAEAVAEAGTVAEGVAGRGAAE